MAALSLGLAAAVAGCGLGKKSVASSENIVGPALKGYTYGGPNPILGANVSLYTTGYSAAGDTSGYTGSGPQPSTATADGYGVAYLRESTTTSSTDGSFSLTSNYVCPAHQFAYIVATGGSTGGVAAGTGASATASISSSVTGITNLTPGSGYTSVPNITIAAPGGSGTQATATAALGVETITEVLAGTGVAATGSPGGSPVAFGGGGTPTTVAVARAFRPVSPAETVNSISNFTANTGSGYTSAPTVVFNSATGSGAAAVATLGTGTNSAKIASITLTASGNGYQTAPTVSFTGGGGTGPTGVTGGIVTTGAATYSVTTNGAGYTSVPTATISADAAATNVVSLGVVTAAIANGGLGYSSTPTVTFDSPPAGGTTATGTATISSPVIQVTVNNGGSGYSNNTTVTLSGGGGTGATATPVINGNGTITAINVTSQGSGYTSAPTVTINSMAGGSNGLSSNPAAVLVAALGRCEDLYTNTTGGAYKGGYIYISELSTVAAAYSLGQFSAVNGAVVSIGAPVANNSTYTVNGYSTGCVAGSPAGCTTTAAAGLLHAFQNAANLVNPFVQTSSANTTITGSTSGAATTPLGTNQPIVPTQLINSLANAMVACVNSANTSASATRACTNYLTAGGALTTAKPNVFSAAVYMASNPQLVNTNVTSAAAITTIVNNCVGITCVYTPTLGSSVPNDLSVAILYPAGTGTGTDSPSGLKSDTGLAIDMDDNVYVTNVDSTTTKSSIFSFASNGTLNDITPENSDAVLATIKQVAVDAASNVYITSSVNHTNPGVKWPTNPTSAPGTFQSSTNSTDLTYTVNGTAGSSASGYSDAVAVDAGNDAWFGTTGTSGNVFLLTAGNAYAVNVETNNPTTQNTVIGISIDPYQNIWLNSTGANAQGIVVNTSAATPPSTAASYTYSGGTATNVIPSYLVSGYGTAFAAQAASGTTPPYYALEAQVGAKKGVAGETITLTSSTSPQISSVAGAAYANATYDYTSSNDAVDGSNQLWEGTSNANTAASAGLNYNPTPLTVANLGHITGCYFVSNACTNPFPAAGPYTIGIDSTGSVWSANGAAGTVVQIVGSAAPTVPLLSVNNSVNPNPPSYYATGTVTYTGNKP